MCLIDTNAFHRTKEFVLIKHISIHVELMGPNAFFLLIFFTEIQKSKNRLLLMSLPCRTGGCHVMCSGGGLESRCRGRHLGSNPGDACAATRAGTLNRRLFLHVKLRRAHTHIRDFINVAAFTKKSSPPLPPTFAFGALVLLVWKGR